MPIRAPKREKIEAELGRSFESFLKEKLAEGLTPNRIGREVKLDPKTIRYYIKKFGLSYDGAAVKGKIERAAVKGKIERVAVKGKIERVAVKGKIERVAVKGKIERRTQPEKSRLVGDHVDICLCVLCTENCREMKMSHKQKRCIIVCNRFKSRNQL